MATEKFQGLIWETQRDCQGAQSTRPCTQPSPEILDISSPLTKSAVFHIPKKIKHGGCEDSNGKEADFVRHFTQFKLC